VILTAQTLLPLQPNASAIVRRRLIAETGQAKVGLNALLTPEESVLMLVDHQAFHFANLHSHERRLVVNNVIAVAKTARILDVPTILTTVLEERGGYSNRNHSPS
jgi:hypothetical protein